MRPGPVGLVVLWGSLTALLTTTAWLAVHVVADEMSGGGTHVLSATAVSSAALDSAQPAQPPAPSASATPKPHPSPSRPPEPTSSSAPHPTHSPTPARSTPTPSPSATGHGSGPGGGGSGSASVSKSFAVHGGTVAAACTGASVELKSAQPQDGWRVEVKDRGPGELEITFRAGEHETDVKIRCSNGIPVLESGDDDGGDD